MKKMSILLKESSKPAGSLACQPALEIQTRKLEPRLTVSSTKATNIGVIKIDWTVDHIKEEQPENSVTPTELIQRRKAQGRSEKLSAARARLAARMADDGPMTLQRARLSAGLSQTDLAELLGSTQPSIARLEAGREKNPGLHTLRCLCTALRLDMNAVEKLFS